MFYSNVLKHSLKTTLSVRMSYGVTIMNVSFLTLLQYLQYDILCVKAKL